MKNNLIKVGLIFAVVFHSAAALSAPKWVAQNKAYIDDGYCHNTYYCDGAPYWDEGTATCPRGACCDKNENAIDDVVASLNKNNKKVPLTVHKSEGTNTKYNLTKCEWIYHKYSVTKSLYAELTCPWTNAVNPFAHQNNLCTTKERNDGGDCCVRIFGLKDTTFP